MRYYFIDWENVGDNGFEGYEKLTQYDRIVIFIKNTMSPSKIMRKVIENTKAKVEIKKFDARTKNAADFNIVSYLGYLVAKDNKANYYIVSRDCGYKAAIETLQRLEPNTSFNLIPSIHNKILEVSKVNRRLIMEQEMQPIMHRFYDEVAFKRLINICAKSTTLGELNNKLVHTFRKEECNEIYKVVKPYFEEALKKIV